MTIWTHVRIRFRTDRAPPNGWNYIFSLVFAYRERIERFRFQKDLLTGCLKEIRMWLLGQSPGFSIRSECVGLLKYVDAEDLLKVYFISSI